jgi:circadian clock protein KaiC
MLHGGIIQGSAVLVHGSPGTGKTTLGMQFLHTGIVEENEPGILITFEEFPHLLLREGQSHNWDLRALEEANKLRIIFTSPRILLSSIQAPSSPLNRTIMEWGVRRIVLDSISHYTRITRDPIELREIHGTLINGLKREGLTSILTSEASFAGLHPERDRLAYMVDAILMMRFVEVDSALQRALLILKMRGGLHAQGIHRFEIREEGIVVTGKFEGLQGLLTGVPRHVPKG